MKRELAAFIFSTPPPIPACKDSENPRKSTTFPFSVFHFPFSIFHSPHHCHAARQEFTAFAGGFVLHAPHVHPDWAFAAVPALLRVIGAEQQTSPPVVNLHTVTLQPFRVVEHRQEQVVLTIAIRGEGVGHMHHFLAILHLNGHAGIRLCAYVIHMHTVGSGGGYLVGGGGGAVVPQVVAVWRGDIQRIGTVGADGGVGTEIYLQVVEVGHVNGVAHASTAVGHYHPVAAVVDDGVGGVGREVLPQVAGRVLLGGIEQQGGQFAQ